MAMEKKKKKNTRQGGADECERETEGGRDESKDVRAIERRIMQGLIERDSTDSAAFS